jgi:DNA-binding MarR family transcriptional regulator
MRKAELIRAIAEAVMLWQDATQAYDEQIGRRYGLNAAERHCVALLVAQGPQSASAIARHVRLTPAAVTALLDRLEARGFVQRRPDPTDRRRVLVEAGAPATVLAQAAYAPLAAAGTALLERFTQAELTTIHRFLAEALALQQRFNEADGPED